ncbi:hypothetical protein CALVIDRAFT_221402 [Calocera viscosa TUFC12733]|uniref:Uncharacterized protein n=1 Tax=Calocera viscosa (strain TUFC12733) TaxID=1330018 RepID=A0A167RKZ4_CALVF|nr:hypothetical protein CALVIDRAFT_221402 [Calocera viscosa TUFC12733]
MPPQAVVSSTSAPEAPSATSTLPQSSAFQSGIVTSATSTAVHVSSTLVSVNVATTSMSSPTGTASVWKVTSTIMVGNTTVVVIEEPAGSLFSLSGDPTAIRNTSIPSGSVFTSLPSSTPGATSESPSGSQLSSWRAFLVAFFAIVFFFLFLRLGVYLLGRRAGQSAVIGSWPRWLQVLCCYRPREDEEDDSLASSTDMRQSYIEGGAEYSEELRRLRLSERLPLTGGIVSGPNAADLLPKMTQFHRTLVRL